MLRGFGRSTGSAHPLLPLRVPEETVYIVAISSLPTTEEPLVPYTLRPCAAPTGSIMLALLGIQSPILTLRICPSCREMSPLSPSRAPSIRCAKLIMEEELLSPVPVHKRFPSSSSDAAVTSASSHAPDDFRQFKHLCRVAGDLHVALEEVQNTQRQLLDILQSLVSGRIALPINNSILQPAQTVWHTPAMCMSAPKGVEKRYYVPAKGSQFFFLISPTPPLLPPFPCDTSCNRTVQTATPTLHSG